MSKCQACAPPSVSAPSTDAPSAGLGAPAPGAFTPESALSWGEAGGNAFAASLLGGEGREDTTPDPAPADGPPDLSGGGGSPPPANPALPGGQPATPAASGGKRTITLTMQQAYSSPSGSNTRTKVGVGEETYFIAHDNTGKWTSTGGKGKITKQPNSYDTYEWTAPSKAGSFKVKYTAKDGSSVEKTMTVVAPSGMSAVSKTDKSYSGGTQGAGMDLQVEITPRDVSFSAAKWKEKKGPATNLTGYFKGKGKKLAHKPNPKWLSIGTGNQVGDEAYFFGWSSPWKKGSYTWSIPNMWRVGTGKGTVFHTSTQVMSITDTRGTSTVTKFGEATTPRTP